MNRDELAESLRIGFKDMIVEADEWRPLADYIISLLDLQLDRKVSFKPVTEESSNKRKEAFAEWMTRGSVYKEHKSK